MKTKTLILIGILLVFTACSERDYRGMYNEKHIPFQEFPNKTIVEQNVQTMRNGENPMARPSYEEYKESITGNKFEPQ